MPWIVCVHFCIFIAESKKKRCAICCAVIGLGLYGLEWATTSASPCLGKKSDAPAKGEKTGHAHSCSGVLRVLLLLCLLVVAS